MPKPQLFHVCAGVVAVLAVAAAVVAIWGDHGWAIALAGLGLAGVVVLQVLADRRSLKAVHEVRSLVELMQLRVVSSLDAARLEAAERLQVERPS